MVSPGDVLAIVQARGGSKGLPNKNLLPLGGHPLIAYSVTSALRARQVARTIVSTDSDAIADVARTYGADVPFRRPAGIAADDTPDLPVFEHALEWLWQHERYRPRLVVQLRPTTPLRPSGLIDRAIELLDADAQADSVRGVTTPKQTPYKMWRAGTDGRLQPLLSSELPEPYNMPRQKLPPVLWQTGHIDVIRTATILDQHSLTGQRVRPIAIEPRYCIDIDSVDDLDAAARLLGGDGLDIDRPGAQDQPARIAALPDQIDLVVFDFDGVFTDGRVIVFQDGTEAVTCHRGDGMGIAMLRERGVPMVVLSTETNPVVAARCRKLQLDCVQGVADKGLALRRLCEDRRAVLSNTVFVGNDVNDLACLQAAGCGVVPADAHPDARARAQIILTHDGGQGAVRELCDAILRCLSENGRHAANT